MAGTYTEEIMFRRDQRSRLKADKILGVSDSSGWHSQKGASESRKKMKKIGSNLSFSFTELRETLTGTHKPNYSKWLPSRKASLGAKTSDSDGSSSNLSPTFDPTASTSTLPSVYSSPETPRPHQRETASYFQDSSIPLNGNAIKSSRINVQQGIEMPSIAEGQEDSKDGQQNAYKLPPLDLPPLSPSSAQSKSSLRFSLSRNRSVTSVTSEGSEVTSRGKGQSRKGLPFEQYVSIRSGLKKGTSNRFGIKSGRHVREWLERADLDRSPSVSGHTIDRLPEPFYNIKHSSLSPTNSSTSIRTLTSQLGAKDATASLNSQWPLPATNFELGEKSSLYEVRSCKVLKRDLQIESVLSLSSDEESDDESNTISHFCQTQKPPRSREAEVTSSNIKDRNISNASSASSVDAQVTHDGINSKSDAYPLNRGRPVRINHLPKCTLAKIPAAEATMNQSGPASITRASAKQSHEWQTRSMEQSSCSQRSKTASLEIAELPASIPSPPEEQEFLPDSPALGRAEQVTGEIEDDELDIFNFPAPPRSRSNSLVPIIQVQLMDDAEGEISRPPLPEFPGDSAIMLTPSSTSCANSIKSGDSTLSSKSSADQLALHPQELPGSAVGPLLEALGPSESKDKARGKGRLGLQRTRTISNVPIYVTGLEKGDGYEDDGDEDVAEFVFSNIF